MVSRRSTGSPASIPSCYLSTVERQYRDSSNLSARVALQARFSTNTYGWQRWVFDRIELPSEALLLELGCGVGLLWRENLDRVPAGWSVTLTDAERRFRFRVVDAQEIPFEDGVFDAVVANHMLYHVQDLPRTLSEIARILKPGGSLYATTVGRHHMREMGKMLAFLDPTHPPDEPIWYYLAFNLENGAEQLSQWFAEVSLVPYEDALAVTEARRVPRPGTGANHRAEARTGVARRHPGIQTHRHVRRPPLAT